MNNLFNKRCAVKQNRIFTKVMSVLVFTISVCICSCVDKNESMVLESTLHAAMMDSSRAHDTLLLRLQQEEKMLLSKQ